MREPTILVGYVIFREGYEGELRKNGLTHDEVAKKWIENSVFKKAYDEIKTTQSIHIYNYDHFMTDFVGAIKLYDLYGDRLCCYIPRGNNSEYKSFLRDYYTNTNIVRFGQEISYELHGDINPELIRKFEKPEFIPRYNQALIVDLNGVYHYNPNRIGD